MYVKADLRAQAGGLQGFQPSALIRPMNQPGVMPASQVPEDQRFDIYGKPISAKDSPFIREHYDLIHGIYYSPATGPEMTVAGQDGLEVAPRLPGAVTTSTGSPALPPSMLTPVNTGVDANGHRVFQSRGSLLPQLAGGLPTIGAGIDSTFIPRTTTSLRSISTTDADGNPVTQLQPVTSTSRRGGAPAPASTASAPASGATPPANGTAGPLTFTKPFTPEQRLEQTQKLGQYDVAIGRVQNVMKNLHLLDSLIDAEKLNLQMDTNGVLKAVVNRNIKLTPAEANFVGDFKTLTEDINLLRGPMGATGFRGPEAFAALQAQKGNLLQNPDVTKRVLSNTLAAMQAQRDPIYNALHPAKGAQGGGTVLALPGANPIDDLVKKYGGK